MCAVLTVAASAGVAATSDAQAAAPAGSAESGPGEPKQRFDVLEFQVEGNASLDAETIERTVYPFLGPDRSIEDVEAARLALEKAYRDRGYAATAVDVPPQRVVDGVVVLKVVEARISRLRVVGARYFSQGRILETVPALAEGTVLNLPQVQEQIVEVNSSVDKRVTPLLRPGRDPGTTEVDLQVEDRLPLHGNVELHNNHAPDTTAPRLVAGLRYGNLFQREHAIGVQAITSPEDTSEVRVLAGSYSLPLAGGTLLFSALHSDSTTFVGSGIGVFGKGSIYGVRWFRPLLGDAPATELSHMVSLGVDYKDFNDNTRLGDGTSLVTPIHYAPLSLYYSGLRTDAKGTTEFGIGLTFALRGVASDQQQFSDKRFQALSNFSILKFNLGRTQKLPQDLSLYARVDGQLTDKPLVSNEQYVAGGADSVRGYLEATQTGDSALHGTFELRSPDYSKLASALETMQLRLFMDGAYLRQRVALPGTRDSFELLSTGLGLTVKAKGGFNLRSDVAWPLRDSGQQQAGRARVHASAAYEF